MSDYLPQRVDYAAPVFTVTVAARLADMHPQTLRGYDRLGLVIPQRTKGRGRRYSMRDIHRLRHIQQLSQSEGINLEGIRRILALENQLEAIQEQLAHLSSLISTQSERSSRLFTAEASGAVHLGRTIVRTPRALTSR